MEEISESPICGGQALTGTRLTFELGQRCAEFCLTGETVDE